MEDIHETERIRGHGILMTDRGIG